MSMLLISLLSIKFHFIPKADLRIVNQRLDHFSDQDTGTFQQRYYETFRYLTNDKFSKVVLYVGGEDTLEDQEVESGSQYLLAQTLQAALFSLEHRFFGESLPFNIEDFETSWLKFLTVDQALADLAYFVQNVIRKHPRAADQISVVVVGGSYPGMVSGWFRLKYPELVDASWASSSSPIIKNANTEFDEHAAEVLKEMNFICYEKFREISHIVEDILDGSDEDKKVDLLQELGFPEDSSALDVLNLLPGLIYPALQYYRNTNSIDVVCESLSDIDLETLKFAWNKLQKTLFHGSLTGQHLPFKSNHLKGTQDSDDFFWEWIMCHEIGGFPVGTGNLKSESVNLTYFEQRCSKNFGLQGLVNETEGNLKYGGLNPPVTKVFYTEGKIDPCSGLGIVPTNDAQQIKSIYIEGASHCADLTPFEYGESPHLTDARIQVLNQIVSWINEKESSSNEKESSIHEKESSIHEKESSSNEKESSWNENESSSNEKEIAEGNGDSSKEGDYFGAVISTIILAVLLIISIVIIIILFIKSKNSNQEMEA